VTKLKLPPETSLPASAEDGQIAIDYRLRVEWTQDLADLEVVRRLAPFHLWRDEVIEERFRYDEKQGVSLAFVRVEKLAEPFVFPNSPRYGGCRSWVTLPDPPSALPGAVVLSEDAHRQREAQIRSVLAP
jgi:hypothetical protein